MLVQLEKRIKSIFITLHLLIIFLLSYVLVKNIISAIIEKNIIAATINIIFIGILYIINIRDIYIEILIKIKSIIFKFQKFTDEELEIIEEAKNIIKSANCNVNFSNIHIHKVNLPKSIGGFFYNDIIHKELDVFISFKKNIKYFSKEACIQSVVHELLHALSHQTKNYCLILFINEGLTEYFTEWLMENYGIKNHRVYIYNVYTVIDLFSENNICVENAFLNYIKFNPEFFNTFLPKEYFSISYKIEQALYNFFKTKNNTKKYQ